MCGEMGGGEAPVAGDISGPVVIPHADKFARARRLDGGIGAKKQVALAAGQQQRMAGLAGGQGGLNLGGERTGFLEQCTCFCRPGGGGQCAFDFGEGVG